MLKKWITALRSGEYKQAKEYLRTNDGFCCLGVACDLINKGIWNPEKSQYVGDIFTWKGSRTLLTPEVEKLLGISHKEANDLASMNDQGKSFNEIADFLEKKYLHSSYALDKCRKAKAVLAKAKLEKDAASKVFTTASVYLRECENAFDECIKNLCLIVRSQDE